MQTRIPALFAATILLSVFGPPVRAEDAPPTYQADPSAFKLLFENENFRVIEITWKVGQVDKPHSHPVPGVTYPLTGCTIKVTNADGTAAQRIWKAGEPTATPVTSSHTSANIGAADCHGIIVERK